MLREDKGSQLFGGTARWARLCAIAGELPRGAVVSRRWIKGMAKGRKIDGEMDGCICSC